MPCCACPRAAPQPLLAVPVAPVDMEAMRIACPSCGAEYDVPDRLLAGGGRSLRCSRCGADFALPAAADETAVLPAALRVAAPAPLPEPEAVPTPTPVAPAAAPAAVLPPAPAAPERAPVAGEDDAALRRAWAASVALVLGAAIGLVILREPVMAAWPPARRLFAALGLV
jgi:predicted Zn finger-like uncharacterized protein